jgi:RNA-directed DNA polymerase
MLDLHHWLKWRRAKHNQGFDRPAPVTEISLVSDSFSTVPSRALSEVGTGQGSVISPLLANIYLFYVLDLHAERWRRREASGDAIIVRYADDFIIGFEHETDAKRFLDLLRERMGKFALALHPEKTRLIEFGRYAAASRRQRGLGKPETFNFLGFTFICGTSRRGAS